MELYKKNILFIVVFTLCAFSVAPAFVWIVDPFHVYHRDTWINKDKYTWCRTALNNALQLKYLHSTDNFDWVLVGNSRSEAFDSNDLRKALKGKQGLNLYGGGLPSEYQIKMLLDAVRSQKIKHAIFMDAQATFRQVSMPLLFKSPKLVIFDARSAPTSLLLILGYFVPWFHKWLFQPLNKIQDTNAEYENLEEFSKISIKNKTSRVIRPVFLDTALDVPDNPLVSIIRNHPNITFHLLFPPRDVIGSEAPILDLKSMSFYLKNTECLENVRIYDFHDVPYFYVSNNWRDVNHYHHGFCKFMAYCIEHDLHRVTAENYNAYKKHIRDVLKSFNPSDYPDRPTTFEELVAYERSLHPELKE